MGLKHTVTKDRKVYGNYQVHTSDGILIFCCNEKKANWYLSRDLAIMDTHNSHNIYLTFKPEGLGNHNKGWGLEKMENHCVNCGSNEFLTRHHIVPYMYRKYFPLEMKEHNFHDVLLLCHQCHENYESHANVLKNELAIKYNIPLNGVREVNRGKLKAMGVAKALLNNNKIPKKRIAEMRSEILQMFNWKRLTKRRLESLLVGSYIKQIKTHGEMVIECIEDLDEFVMMWRKHFMDNNELKYLPKQWNSK